MPSRKQFDVDESFDRALDAFWEGGYQATSMSKLLESMGIQKGSFYATFEGKHEIFVRALEHYVDRRFEEFRRSLEGLSPAEAIEKMFDLVEDECRSKDRRKGCFIINMALEMAPTDDEVGRIVRRTLKTHQKMLTDLLAAGQRAGDFGKSLDPTTMGQTLLAQIISMRVFARAGMGPASIAQIRTQALKLLK